MRRTRSGIAYFTGGTGEDLLLPAIGQSFVKLNPRQLVRNPVMFVVEIVSVLATLVFAVGVAAKLGLDYAALKEVNPEIVMLSMPALAAEPAEESPRAYSG